MSSFNVNGAGYTIVPNSSFNFTVPAGGKALFLTFMIGVDLVGSPLGGFQFYQCELFIDNVGTGLFLGIQEPGSGDNQVQFTVGGVINVGAGNHIIDARIRRIRNNINTTNQRCETITSNFSAAYIN